MSVSKSQLVDPIHSRAEKNEDKGLRNRGKSVTMTTGGLVSHGGLISWSSILVNQGEIFHRRLF